jgi:hypothetical protein
MGKQRSGGEIKDIFTLFLSLLVKILQNNFDEYSYDKEFFGRKK